MMSATAVFVESGATQGRFVRDRASSCPKVSAIETPISSGLCIQGSKHNERVNISFFVSPLNIDSVLTFALPAIYEILTDPKS